jgi:hypothetical protein
MSIAQAYVNGFVKRASEYGLSEQEAIELLKTSGVPPQHMNDLGAALSTKAPVKPAAKQHSVNKPYVSPAMQNERMMQPGQRAYNQIK